ncbi:hypothetical protein Salat_2863200 [Sesamum alatum]|uniref:Uncharacterized protein n=1 Tax=Sesamum alatum TaxID=300844 RepID=A0AAE1XM95_9LAMI|nr:hypothetical protein Salat_2863200 [Sesamum alatum]
MDLHAPDHNLTHPKRFLFTKMHKLTTSRQIPLPFGASAPPPLQTARGLQNLSIMFRKDALVRYECGGLESYAMSKMKRSGEEGEGEKKTGRDQVKKELMEFGEGRDVLTENQFKSIRRLNFTMSRMAKIEHHKPFKTRHEYIATQSCLSFPFSPPSSPLLLLLCSSSSAVTASFYTYPTTIVACAEFKDQYYKQDFSSSCSLCIWLWLLGLVEAASLLSITLAFVVWQKGYINHPIYWMLGAGFLWMSFWILGVIGALNFYVPPLDYNRVGFEPGVTLRGMQSSTQFCFQRALSKNLGSACLGSLFVPAIEALRIVARGLNLLEGETRILVSAAHIAASGHGIHLPTRQRLGLCSDCCIWERIRKRRHKNTWELFEKREMWRHLHNRRRCMDGNRPPWLHRYPVRPRRLHRLPNDLGFAMALPHACVSCYYVCYAENPDNRLFDKTIPDRLELIKSGRDVVVPTPRVPRRFQR